MKARVDASCPDNETLARTAATRTWWNLLPYSSGFGDAAHRGLMWEVSGGL